MKKHIIGSLLLFAFLWSASGTVIPIFSDDFETGTLAKWTTTGTSPLDPSTPTNAVPPSPAGRWSAYMNTSIDRMHHNIIADNGGAEATGHLMFTHWIYDEGTNGGTVGATRVFNEIRAYNAGTGLPNGGTTASGTLAQLLASGKFNSVTLPGEVFTTAKYQGRVAFGPGAGGSTGWFNLNGPGSPNRSVGWHRFDIEVMPGGDTVRFYVDGILCRSFSGAAVDTFDTVILGPGLGSQIGNAWIDGISLSIIDDPPTITCPPDQAVPASSATGAVVTYPAPTAADDRGAPTVACNPPSGSNFPIGTTTVTCVATDSSSQTATCTFTVTVRPRPVDITCPKNVVVKGLGPTIVNYPPPTIVAGDCPPITVTCVPPSGSAFPPGTTVVNCVATDACGTSDQCRFLVTVRSLVPIYVNFPRNYLPPPEGMFISPFEVHYENGLMLRNVIDRKFSPTYPPPPPGETAREEFDSEMTFEFSTDGGANYRSATAPAHVIVQITHTQDDGATQFFDTEMLALDIAGGGLPPGVMIRESPTRASVGRTSIQSPRDPASGFRIGSFFDVFTEVSLDGGQSWSPSVDSERVDLEFDPTQVPAVQDPSPNLPPRHGVFAMTPGSHHSYGEGILIRNFRHHYPSESSPPPAPGESGIYDFRALVDFELSLDGGQTWHPTRADADARVVMVHIGRLLESSDSPTPGVVDLYDTEMLQLDIHGGDLPPGVMLRESPSRPSLGGTALRQAQAPTGSHHLIHSFFDIFTELTVDGGNNWVSPPEPERVELKNYAEEVDQPNDLLPPPAGTYANSPLDAGISWGDGMVMMRNIRSSGFDHSAPPPPPGGSQLYDFNSQMTFELSTDGGQTWTPGSASAKMKALVETAIASSQAGLRYFDTEMLQMDITMGGAAGAPVMIRESPTKASLGRTSIRQLQPGGPSAISSFFDIFTEISLDGGQSWMPADNGPVNMVLQKDATNGQLVCADGRPLANCQVKIEFYDQNGLCSQATTITDPSGNFTVIFGCSGPHFNSYFLISSPCCGHTWTIPSAAPLGNLGTLVCDQCGQTNCVPAPAGMVDWWPFDETTGVIAHDIMGFDNQGARQGGPAVVTGKVKNALCFNGQNQYVQVLNHPEVNFFGSCPNGNAEPFTIDAWVKVESIGGQNFILDKRELLSATASRGYCFFVDNGRLSFTMADAAGSTTYVEPNPSITAGVWYHVAAAVQRCDAVGINTGRLYVNGLQKLVFAPRNGDISNLQDLLIAGRQPAFGYNWLRGCLDEIEIFKRALPQSEIQAIYQAGSGGKCKPCIQLECPGEVKAWTCNRSTNLCYALPHATGNCGDVTVVCTPPPCSPFSVGTNVVNCEARDSSGNKTNCTFNVVVVADTQPPVISCPKNTIERWMCAINAGVIVTYGVTATDDCDPTVTINCVPPSGSMFPPGFHTVTCTATDDCGNRSQCSFEVHVVVDNEPPVLVCPGDIKLCTCEPNGTRVGYVVSVSDNHDPSPTVSCSPPSGAFFPIGTTTVTCVARDRCGNNTSCQFNVTVNADTLPPRLSCPADISFDDCKEHVVRYDVVAEDDCDPNPGVICTPASGSVFQPGTTTVHCFASDQCGRRSDCSFNVIINCRCVPPPPDMVDWWPFDEPVGSTIANDIEDFNNFGVHVNSPTIVTGKVKNAVCFNGDNQYIQVRDHPEINFFGDCANDVAESFTIDAWIRQDPNAVAGVRTFVDKRDNPASPQGYSFYVVNGRLGFQLGNGVGNNSCNAAGAACFNYVEPTASITPGVWHFVAVTVQRCRGSGILYVDGSPVLTFTPLGGDYNNAADMYIGIRNPAFGPANFRGCVDELEIFKRALAPAELQSIYNAGSAGKCKPCIRCPDDITVETCSDGTNVCYQLPPVSEDCQGVTVHCNPPPCSFFPANTSTLVVCDAVDITGQSVQRCQFAVTVIGDNRPPTITCPPDITVPNDPGSCGAKVDYPSPQASDNCPGVTVTCSPPPGSFFPVASTLVTCTATDGAGHSTSCTFAVTVRDTEPPRIVCPQDIRRDGCHETVVDYTVSATDNCPGVTVICTPPSGSPFPVGSTGVTCTATDSSGNTASCTFKVTIVCPCVPPPAGMVDWWTFDEPAGPIANDIAGFNNIGVHMNSPSVIAGKVLNAVCFNGDNQYIEVRDHPEVNFLGSCNAAAAPAESFTIDAWIRADALASVATILDKRVNPSDPIGYSLFVANGRLGFQMADGSGGGGVCGPSASCQNYGEPTPSITVGNWHFVAVTVQRCDPNGGPGVGRLYVDGNIVLTFTPRKGDMNNPANLLIGVRQPAFGGANFRGCIDELEYFKRALTQTEIQAIYNAGSNGKCKPCLRCPPDITVQTCARGTNVCYPVPENCPGLTVRCTPPPCSFFPANTSTLVVCEGYDSTGVVWERCQFAVTVITPRPKLEIVYLPNGLVRICWVTDCPGWRLQCTRSLVSPIMWQFVNAPVTVSGNRYCVTLPAKGLHQFYRLCRRDGKEIIAADNLFPPLGTYRSPDDLVAAYLIGDPDRPLLLRKFAHPIPPGVDRRPPPCATCTPALYQIPSQLSFQVSMDGGESWLDATAASDGLVKVDPPEPDYPNELLRLDSHGNLGPRPFMIRESPTKASVGRTSVREIQPGGPYAIGSFFDVFTEISLDNGQTWTPAETEVPMDLTSP